MTERKYTDEEVIKALGYCKINSTYDGCRECLYVECPTQKGCVGELMEDVINLINRQKAELDICRTALKLTSEELPEVKVIHHRNIQRAKAEAIRAFAERLKKKSYPFPCAIGVENAVTIRAINDLVKEMTEDIQ